MAQVKADERNFMLEVIELYRKFPAIWKIKSDEYSNRNKKEEAYELLLKKYRERYENATREDLNFLFIGSNATASAMAIVPSITKAKPILNIVSILLRRLWRNTIFINKIESIILTILLCVCRPL